MPDEAIIRIILQDEGGTPPSQPVSSRPATLSTHTSSPSSSQSRSSSNSSATYAPPPPKDDWMAEQREMRYWAQQQNKAEAEAKRNDAKEVQRQLKEQREQERRELKQQRDEDWHWRRENRDRNKREKEREREEKARDEELQFIKLRGVAGRFRHILGGVTGDIVGAVIEVIDVLHNTKVRGYRSKEAGGVTGGLEELRTTPTNPIGGGSDRPLDKILDVLISIHSAIGSLSNKIVSSTITNAVSSGRTEELLEGVAVATKAATAASIETAAVHRSTLQPRDEKGRWASSSPKPAEVDVSPSTHDTQRFSKEDLAKVRAQFDTLSEQEISEAANSPEDVANKEFQRWSDESDRLFRAGGTVNNEDRLKAQQLASVYLWAAQKAAQDRLSNSKPKPTATSAPTPASVDMPPSVADVPPTPQVEAQTTTNPYSSLDAYKEYYDRLREERKEGYGRARELHEKELAQKAQEEHERLIAHQGIYGPPIEPASWKEEREAREIQERQEEYDRKYGPPGPPHFPQETQDLSHGGIVKDPASASVPTGQLVEHPSLLPRTAGEGLKPHHASKQKRDSRGRFIKAEVPLELPTDPDMLERPAFSHPELPRDYEGDLRRLTNEALSKLPGYVPDPEDAPGWTSDMWQEGATRNLPKYAEGGEVDPFAPFDPAVAAAEEAANKAYEDAKYPELQGLTGKTRSLVKRLLLSDQISAINPNRRMSDEEHKAFEQLVFRAEKATFRENTGYRTPPPGSWQDRPTELPEGHTEGGPIRGYASGGQAHGTDTVPAMLTPGEFVINAKSASQHKELLQAINSGGVQRRATGGPIHASTSGIPDYGPIGADTSDIPKYGPVGLGAPPTLPTLKAVPMAQTIPTVLPAAPKGVDFASMAAMIAGPEVQAALAIKQAADSVVKGTIGAIGGAASGIASPNDKAAESVTKLGEGISSTVGQFNVLGLAVGESVKALGGFMDAVDKTADKYSQYNAQIASATAIAEVRTEMGNLRRAQEAAPELARFVQAQSDMQQKFEDIKVKLLTQLLQVVNPILEILNAVIPSGKGIEVAISALLEPIRLLSEAAKGILGIQQDREFTDPVDPTDIILRSNDGARGANGFTPNRERGQALGTFDQLD